MSTVGGGETVNGVVIDVAPQPVEVAVILTVPRKSWIPS